MEGYIFTATGLEHSERGMPEYSPKNHMNMGEKRLRKIMGSLQDLYPPEKFFADGDADIGVIAWGSTFGPALEAVHRAQGEGIRASALKITSLYPYHAKEIREFMDKCREILIPELNLEGQLANLIGHLHKRDVTGLNRVTGEPYYANIILEEIKRMV